MVRSCLLIFKQDIISAHIPSSPLFVYTNREAENEKAQADSLLHDIIPVHVMDQIKLSGEYSQSHKDVGVVFISITNFDEFYDESFEGGKKSNLCVPALLHSCNGKSKEGTAHHLALPI